MQIGQLNERVTIQEFAEQNDAGDLTVSWVPVATVPARVISQRGTEAFEAARNNAREVIRVLMRYRTDITTKHRLVWASQNYNITAVDRSKRQAGELWVTAEAQGAL